MDIVLITRDRPKLTEQTIRTLQENASDWSKHRLAVVFDGADEERTDLLDLPRKLVNWTGISAILSTGRQLGVGGAKNFGADWFGMRPTGLDRRGLLMFSDNDMYYLPGWDAQLEYAMARPLVPITQLGGWRHPFHALGERRNRWWASGAGILGKHAPKGEHSTYEVDAVTGNCFVIRWSDWLKYGPLDATAIGPGQSEDFALSQKIRAGGGLVATLDPPIAIHCGITNSEGNPATGAKEMLDMALHQITEHGLEGKVLVEAPTELIPRGLHPAGTATAADGKFHRPATAPIPRSFRGINCGSGQRRFNPAYGWINVDSVSRPPDQIPDVVCDVGKTPLPCEDNSVDMVVLHHVVEHFGCNEANNVLRECWRVLKLGGSLLIFVPDMRALAGRWLGGELSTQIYLTSVYGAYQGEEGDRHKWGYDRASLKEYLEATLWGGGYVVDFDWREIQGADIARDFWIIGMEAVKW